MAFSKDYAYYIDRDNIGIVEKSATTGEWDSISTAGKTVRVYCSKLPVDGDLDGLTDDPSFPEVFHEAIVFKAISTGYMDPRNMNPEGYAMFQGEYLKSLKEAKKYSKRNHSTTGFIKPVDF